MHEAHGTHNLPARAHLSSRTSGIQMISLLMQSSLPASLPRESRPDGAAHSIHTHPPPGTPWGPHVTTRLATLSATATYRGFIHARLGRPQASTELCVNDGSGLS